MDTYPRLTAFVPLADEIRADPFHALHGSKSTYDRHKCRCPKCRAANAAWMAEYRVSKVYAARAAARRLTTS